MDLDLISRQLQRETQSHEEARIRLQTATRAAQDRSYASSTIYGRKAINSLLKPVVERITKRYGALSSGKAGLDAIDVVKHLKDADPYAMALITMKVVLDVLGKEPEPGLQELTTKIGAAIQLELRMNYYAIQEPELFKKTEFFFHKSAGTNQKATVFKRAFNKEEINWPSWPPTTNHKVGVWLLVCLADVTGWIKRTTVFRGGKRRRTITYTREFLAHRDTIIAAAESLAFCQWPMLCPPVDWTNDTSGGYLTESVRQCNPLIRKAGKVASTKQGDIPLAMLNNLQQQVLQINKSVFAIADHFYEKKISVGKFRCDPPLPIPENLLAGDASEDEVTAYKRARRNAENYNADLPQKNYRTTEVMYVARKYVNELKLFLSASFDYRGRLYFHSVFNPQGTDFDKSLFYFADEGPVNEYWLAVHTATCFGLDKETMENRVKWTRENTSLIKRIADDPIHNHEWREASEPWCFLSSVLEYAACVLDCTKHTSGLPIGIDATCSGLQHLSALTLCHNTAAETNVIPTEKPADIYKTVAEASKAHMPEKYHDWMNRKITKRSCMCCPYGVSMSSSRNYIRLALREESREFDSSDLTIITNAIFKKAIPEVLPGPIELMQWLKSSALEILNSGKEVITWTSPSGFVVSQDLRHSNTVRIDTRLMGGARINCVVGDGYLEPDRSHHRSALAPNFVHANDAALIHLTFAYWDKPFSVIHDCVLGRSCDMDAMGSEIRLHFAEMYKAPVLQQWADEVGVQIPPDLIKNTLDIESVNNSTYFFC